MPGPGYSYFGANEQERVAAVLRSWERTRDAYGMPDRVPFVEQFEAAVCERFGSPHCVAVNSGTSALLTSLAALGVGPGDEVVAPGYTFIASIASIVYAGATPVLAEIDESLTLDAEDVEARITDRTKAIMAVHMLGAPCDMTALERVAKRHGLLLVEDVAQACGGSHGGRPLGTIGDAGAFSLNPFKVITSGEGGLFLTREWGYYQRGYSFHDQGWFPGRGTPTADEGDGDLLVGLNLRMPDIVAAVGMAQLERLDEVLAATRQVKRALASLIPTRAGMSRRTLHDEGECSTVLVYVFDDADAAEKVAAAIGSKTLDQSGRHHYANMTQLAALGAGVAAVCPFRPTDALRGQSYGPGSLPRTDDVLRRSVALSVGVSDSYLGAGVGVTVRSGDQEIRAMAERYTAAVDEVLA